jgi:CHAT domain-containing protein
VIDAIRTVPGFEEFGRQPDSSTIHSAALTCPLVYGAVTEFGASLFLVRASGHITAIQLPQVTARVVEQRARRYFNALDALRSSDSADIEDEWVRALDEIADWLGEAVMAELCTSLDKLEVDEAVLLLPGWLNLLPVPVARLPHSRIAAGELVGLRTAPSAAALVAASRVAVRSEEASALLVADPEPSEEEPLEAASAELAGAKPAFERVTVLTKTHASRGRVLEALPNHDVAHIACHGVGDPQAPLSNHLLLAKDERLTLSDLLNLRVWNMRLCFLSACDTGVVGSLAPDEVVSLPAGLVQVGTAGVIATQWPVWDAAAAVFSVTFYALWPSATTNPADAFYRAQLWLRNAPHEDVRQLIAERVASSDGLALMKLLAGAPPDYRPFCSLRDWAAFIYVGC